MKRRLLFVVNVDWFFMSHRLPVAIEALRRGYDVHVATTLTDRADALRHLGLVLHPLVLQRASAGPVALLSGLGQIWRTLWQVRPDVVHLVTIKPVLLGGLAARLARSPAVVAAISGLGFVFTSRGGWARVRRALVGLLYRVALGHPNLRVIFQNEDDRASVSALARLAPDRSTLIRGSGVDLDVFRYTPPQQGRAPIVLLACRLLGDKGVREFCAAARMLRERASPGVQAARFVVVGETDPGNPASLPEAELQQWARDGLVELWGHRQDMPAVLADADVVVLPSYLEGMPKVLLEAAACGRPVVTTDVPGCRDAIEPGVTGVLVPVRDAAALAQAIGSLLQDADRRGEMGRAGRRLAERCFDVRQVVEEHLRIYDQLAQDSGA